MTKSSRVREYIKTHPWSTNNQIGAAIGFKTNDVAAITTADFKCGKLIRQEAYNVGSHPCYIYAMSETGTAPELRAEVEKISTAKEFTQPTARDLFNMDGIEKIAEDLSNIIFQKVCDKLQEKLAALTQSKVNTTPEEFVANLISNISQPKLCVLIVGLLPQQAGMIQTEFGNDLNLKFWKEGSLGQLRKTAQSADFVLLFTSKISHDATNAVASVNKNMIRVVGGMTTLREKLTEIFCEN